MAAAKEGADVDGHRPPLYSSRLVITGAERNTEILSMEGTTQGDNLAMIFYALGITPIVRALNEVVYSNNHDVMQCWLADDATAVGKIVAIRKWWDKLIDMGRKHGYSVNVAKTWIIVKNEDGLRKAKEIFGDTNVKYTLEGKRHLGACIGSETFKDTYCKEKVENWCIELGRLCEIAQVNPQVAYSAYIHSFQHKFTYYFRTISNFEKYLQPIDDLLTYGFLSTLFGSAITPLEREIFAMPTRYGGLGVQILSDKAPRDFAASMFVTSTLVEEIKNQGSNIPDDNKHKIDLIKHNNEKFHQEMLESLKNRLPPSEKGVSSWLVTLPRIHSQ